MLHEALLSSAVLLLSAVRLHFATSPGSFDFVLLVAQTRISVFQVDYQLDKMHEKPLWTRTSMRSGRCGGGLAVGETQNKPFQLSFNSSLKVDFQGSRVTSDSGLLLVRELDERLGFGELIEQHLADGRGNNIQLPLTDLMRQSVYKSTGWLRGSQRCGAPLPGPGIPTHRLRQNLGARRSFNLALAIVRDGTADATRKPCRPASAQSGTNRQGGSHRFVPAGGAGHGQH